VTAAGHDIEALLTGAPERVRALRAELREWADPEGLRRALDRLMPGAGENVPGGDPVEHVSRHWFAEPDRVREERAGAVTIRRGDAWWMDDPHMGVLTNGGDPAQTTTGAELIRAWVAPGRILPHVELSVVDTAQAAGRPALRVRAVPREGPGAVVDLAFLGGYADEWELHVDAERGVLLGTAALGGGERFQAVEPAEIAFDEHLDDELFAIPG
jgi:hypothetical protein